VDTLIGEEPGHGLLHAAVGKPVGRPCGHRHVAALNLVTALCAGLDPGQSMANGMLDRLIVAAFEVEHPVILDAAPVAPEGG